MGNEMFRHAYIYAQMRKGEIPDIYLQDEKYFKGYEDEIKEMFSDGIETIPYVGIHVRRADNPINPDEPNYSDNPFYVDLCATDYYEKAMAMFPDDTKFIIFTDDPEFCKERFSIPINNGTELEDFNMLASCEHQIIANSSFSWWAGFLNPNKNKVVVAPKEWFADGQIRTVLPKEWILV